MDNKALFPRNIQGFQYITDFRQGAKPIVDKGSLGSMQHGGNGVAQDSQPFSLGPDGLTVTVTSKGDIASRTVYVVSSPHLVLQGHTPKGVVPGKFSYSPHLIAEVLFDKPNCQEVTTSPTTWAVGLNFKSGDQTDAIMDQSSLVGATCQFVNGGNVNFNGTEYDPSPSYAYSGSYADYNAKVGTQSTTFLLRVNLGRTATSADASAGLTLIRPDLASESGYDVTYIPPEGQGILNETVSPITDNVYNLSEAESNAQKLTAAGIVVVNHKGQSTVSVRLLEFNLMYYNYPYSTKL